MILVTRKRTHPATIAYIERRLARRQNTTRSKPLPQALPRPQPLPATRTRTANDDLTDIEASLALAPRRGGRRRLRPPSPPRRAPPHRGGRRPPRGHRRRPRPAAPRRLAASLAGLAGNDRRRAAPCAPAARPPERHGPAGCAGPRTPTAASGAVRAQDRAQGTHRRRPSRRSRSTLPRIQARRRQPAADPSPTRAVTAAAARPPSPRRRGDRLRQDRDGASHRLLARAREQLDDRLHRRQGRPPDQGTLRRPDATRRPPRLALPRRSPTTAGAAAARRSPAGSCS